MRLIFGPICWWGLGHRVYPGSIIERFITNFYSRCFAVLNGSISRVDEEYCPALDLPTAQVNTEVGSRGWIYATTWKDFLNDFLMAGIGIKWDR